jgi:hypothetical protein
MQAIKIAHFFLGRKISAARGFHPSSDYGSLFVG